MVHREHLLYFLMRREVLEALGSSIPKPVFIPLLAGWEEFNRNGKALPDETVRWVTLSSHNLSEGAYTDHRVECSRRNVTLPCSDPSLRPRIKLLDTRVPLSP